SRRTGRVLRREQPDRDQDDQGEQDEGGGVIGVEEQARQRKEIEIGRVGAEGQRRQAVRIEQDEQSGNPRAEKNQDDAQDLGGRLEPERAGDRQDGEGGGRAEQQRQVFHHRQRIGAYQPGQKAHHQEIEIEQRLCVRIGGEQVDERDVAELRLGGPRRVAERI